MFLKSQRKILKDDNTIVMKSILVEMEAVSEDSTSEERGIVYYKALRKAVDILAKDWLLLWGQEEIVDCKLSTDPEYNLMVKSTEQWMDVEPDDIYLLD